MNDLKENPKTKMNEKLSYALAYVKKMEWSIFPLVPGGKKPATPNGFKDSTSNLEQIYKWWKSNRGYGIGLPTGELNNILVVDIDPRDGGDMSLEDLIATYGELPHTVETMTPGGGSHYFFKFDERINKSGLSDYPGIDFQGNGQYVVLPPSGHPNKKQYEFELSSEPISTEIAEAPEWLIELLSSTNRINGKYQAKPVSEYIAILQGVDEGNRNNALLTLIGHLIVKLDYREAFEIVHIWNETRMNPPLDEDAVTVAFNNVLNRELEKR